MSIEKFAGYKTEEEEKMQICEMLALRNKVKEEELLEIYGGSREETGMKMYLHGPTDSAKTLKLRFSCRGSGPARKKWYTSSREEDDAQMCPSGKSTESRTHNVAECEMYKEQWDVLGEMRKIYECNMEQFGTLDSSEKTIAILGDRWWPQKAKQQVDKTSKICVCHIQEKMQ